MMILIACLLALSLQSAQAQCNEVANCNSCSNPAPFCANCPAGSTLSESKEACLDCGNFCITCDATADDATVCTNCTAGYYLSATGSCESCGDGCLSCEMNAAGTLECNECMASGYTHNTAADGKPCVECDRNCQTCSMGSDGASTVCSKCDSYSGFSIQGYFLKTEDKSCKSCGSKASSCVDNGSGQASITSCYNGYEVESTTSSRCLACPTDCSSCNGEENSGVATCTACKDTSGTFLVDKSCVSCGDNCETCEDESTCAECVENYRVEDGACVACPPKCPECSLDDSTSEVVCDECQANYGAKSTDSITCDKCTMSNCATCTTNGGTGEQSCTACVDKYGLDENAVCVACPAGCTKCRYDNTETKIVCKKCDTGYTIPPADGACIDCAKNIPECTVCDGTIPSCRDCKTGYYYFNPDSTCKAKDDANCVTYTAGGCTACKDGYKDNDPCAACTGQNCKTCTADIAKCDTCPEGYSFEVADTPGDCEACGISSCDTCSFTTEGDGSVTIKCTACVTGYVVYDADTESADEGLSCKKCPTGCDTCTYDYTNSKTVCSNDGCSDKYTNADDGECIACPAECAACSYADGKVSCTAGNCGTGFTLNQNSGECEACPENCGTCEWDTETSTVVCSSGGCVDGYGLISGGQCGECSDNCEVCSVKNAEEAPDTLSCDTCMSTYAKNALQCGACSSNCVECDDDEGTMVCKTCKDGYALDSSSKLCVSCNGNCDSCTSSNGVVKCTDCVSGYGLAADKLSCVACTTAAFENCRTCGDIDSISGVAPCDSCVTGFTLEDMDSAGPCIDVSGLQCAARVDYPAMCSDCMTGYEATDMGLCAIGCYACGDMSTQTPVPQAECQIPASDDDIGEGLATIIQCTTGICRSYYFPGGNVIAGCAQVMNSTQPSCPEEQNLAEYCPDTAAVTGRCQSCCTTDNCNTIVAEMDGTAGSLPSCTINFLLLAVTALLAICRIN